MKIKSGETEIFISPENKCTQLKRQLNYNGAEIIIGPTFVSRDFYCRTSFTKRIKYSNDGAAVVVVSGGALNPGVIIITVFRLNLSNYDEICISTETTATVKTAT